MLMRLEVPVRALVAPIGDEVVARWVWQECGECFVCVAGRGTPS